MAAKIAIASHLPPLLVSTLVPLYFLEPLQEHPHLSLVGWINIDRLKFQAALMTSPMYSCLC